MKVTGTKPQTTNAAPTAGELTRSEQDDILKLLNAERSAAKKAKSQPPIAAKYMVQPPKPSIEEPSTPPIAPKYMVVPGPIVARYMVVPPWAGVDAHQAVINKATKNGIVSVKEATSLAKLFNRDITEAKKEGSDIRTDVAEFLHQALRSVKMSAKAKDIVFGKNGPGHLAQGHDGPIYILPPIRPPKPGDAHDGPIYILPQIKPPEADAHDGPIYILPPVKRTRK
ncbi:MAG: hypothetical protein HY901_20480 [Deltaproteobacteria bacterium]|nr:hypothetical protein [Deltaproteobacteria bacterium]